MTIVLRAFTRDTMMTVLLNTQFSTNVTFHNRSLVYVVQTKKK